MKNKTFNEMARVQIPALIHLNRLGYDYVGRINETMAGKFYDEETNIILEIFSTQFQKLNPHYKDSVNDVLKDIKDRLDYNDLGRSFFEMLQTVSPYKLIDFDNIENNTFHYTGEFTCKNGEDSFRPDITLFINGLPLVFIEVKKPNNKEGILAETRRLEERFQNKRFRRFINITQLIILSNNLEYDTIDGIVPVQGAFYTTISKNNVKVNCFREEHINKDNLSPFIKDFPYKPINETLEKQVLKDFSCQVLFNAPEYKTNKNINSPTNRILTSMCSKERLLYILKYGLVYLDATREVDGKMETIYEKHIIRYQQLFASMAVTKTLTNNKNSGIIWHTQGSGKTALSYYLHKILTDFYAKTQKVPKFYFIVDRIDLLEQAQNEFTMRGLSVTTIENRRALTAHFKENTARQSNTGKNEIVVINIQKFDNDDEEVEIDNYATNLQRVFIVDEAHRGYSLTGSFLRNLLNADKNAVKIALTGTPLLQEERESWRIFGDYIHTYYYDKSIQDGYTLKIMREDIATEYRENLLAIYSSLETLVQKKDVKKEYIVEHDKYVDALYKYIVNDFHDFRILHNDNDLGGMIICETSGQAKKLYDFFNTVEIEGRKPLKVALILHDIDDKKTRKQYIHEFKKEMTIDILIVHSMLLTGFDAPRLKRLYFCRKLKEHNLLQALTRVNRPFKRNKYGYIVDFADIKQNFEETNEEYLRELSRFDNLTDNGTNSIGTFAQIIEDKQVIINKLNEVKEILFDYTTDNLEIFCQEISDIEDKGKLLELKRALEEAKDFYNIVRTFGDNELKALFKQTDIHSYAPMIQVIQDKINNMNMKEAFENADETSILINDAMQYIEFNFRKLGEDELQIIGSGIDLKEKWQRAINSFATNIDQEDPEFITLRDAFIERFKNTNFQIKSVNEYNELSRYIDEVIKKLKELNNADNTLAHKYNGDKKYVRTHKRIREENSRRKSSGQDAIISEKESEILEILYTIKESIDNDVTNRQDILNNEGFFNKTVMAEIANNLRDNNIKNTSDDRKFICNNIVKEYLNQYNDYVNKY